MTKNRGESLKRKAEELNDRQMHDKISAHLGQDMDLVAVDVKYLAPCVNSYLKKRLKDETIDTNSKNKNSAFMSLVKQLYNQLIVNKSVVCLSTIRDTYRTLLQERGRLLLTTPIQRETNIATCKRTFLRGLFPPLIHFLDTSCDWIRQQVQKMRGRTLNMPLISYYIRYQRRRLAVLDLKS